MRRRMTVTEETRRALLMTLLRIYMGQGEGSVQLRFLELFSTRLFPASRSPSLDADLLVLSSAF